MIMRFTVHLRGKDWTAYDRMDDLERVGSPDNETLKHESLTTEEFAVVDIAERKARDEAYRRYRAQVKDELRRAAEGAALVRDFVWDVEEDHIQRCGQIWDGDKRVWGTICLKFSELTNDELSEVMRAKQQQALNRGMGGFLRRLGRKLENWGSP